MTAKKHRPSGLTKPYKYHSGWRIQWFSPNGQRQSKTFPFKLYGSGAYQAAIEELNRLKGDLQAIVDGRKHYNPKSLTLQEFFTRYWEPDRNSKKRNPRNDKDTWARYYKDTLGPLELKEIDAAAVANFKRVKFDKQSPATQRNILALLRAMLNYARSLDLIYLVPHIKQDQKIGRKDFKYLKDSDQIMAFLQAAKKEKPFLFYLYATAVYSGMRAGELCGLHWDEVDLAGRIITIKFSHENPPKNGHVRHVPILDSLLPILTEWKRVSADFKNQGGLVFPSPDGGVMLRSDSTFFQKDYKAVLDAAELETMRFHELRHTFGCQWVLSGGNVFELMEVMGHSSFEVTRMYTKIAKEHYKGAGGMFSFTAPKKNKKVKGQK